MSATEQELLAAIWARPLEDAPRLIYADWLDERGDAPRAEFVRVQVEAARLSKWDDRRDEAVRAEVRARFGPNALL
jgi:uncharacterized protein (TIGR02996 family)